MDFKSKENSILKTNLGSLATSLGLPHTKTAQKTVSHNQKLWLLFFTGLMLLAAFLNWRLSLLTLIAILTIFYFVDLLFNFFLIYKSLSKSPALTFSPKALSEIKNQDLPLYTIFCPLYRESAVLPQFIKAMSTLDYPKDKLQILLLLEEDDPITIEAAKKANLPPYFEIAIVPHSHPKTKPKAMNHGLGLAKGEYITIYDAEDMPDPEQLKKAILAFKTLGPKVVCVQSKLNFYNQNQNFVTRLFTAEYSLWFDLVLPGLQTLRAPIPLGGTSNHFRTKDLHKLKGWDPFNVTEDCDLGVRLAKEGYSTAIIDSTTLEEANSHMLNWYRQRSRWIKGYMQTYLVHMRAPKELWKEWHQPHLLTFQLVVGGKILSMFVNPFLWLVTITYFAFRAQAAPYIEPFFPPWILYLGVFSLVFGNFLYLYYYMVALAKKNYDGLIKYAFLVPFYWLGMSLAAWKALYEIIFKPHYWAKTVHGFHLSKTDALSEQRFGDAGLGGGTAQNTSSNFDGKEIRQNLLNYKIKIADLLNSGIGSGGVLVASLLIANFLNLVFNIILGRALSLEDFATVTLYNTILNVMAVGLLALGSSVNYKVAFFVGQKNIAAAESFTKKVKRAVWGIAAVLSLAWILLIPVFAKFFHVNNFLLVLCFTPVITLGSIAAIQSAYLRGRFRFALLGVAVVVEALSKTLAAIVFVGLGIFSWASLAVPLSIVVSFMCTWTLVAYIRRSDVKRPVVAAAVKKNVASFPVRYFSATLVNGLSTTAFLNIDVLLAKHYLTPADAGAYALLSLAGKMVYLVGTLLSSFVVSIVSRHEGAGTNPDRDFYRLLAWTVVTAGGAFGFLALGGKYFIPLLFGERALVILPFIIPYCLAMALFSLTGMVISYHVVRKHYTFPALMLASSSVLIVGLVFLHSSISDFVKVMVFSGILSFVAIFSWHFFRRNSKFLWRGLIDFFGAFIPSKAIEAKDGAKKILIFNWRDTEHAYAGGAEIYTQELAKRWVKEGNHVTLFCGNDGKQSRAEILDGVHVIRRGGFYFVYVWAFVYYMLQFRGKFDVILDCHNGIPFFTPLFTKEKVYCLMHHVHQQVFYHHLWWPLAAFAAFLEKTMMPLVYRNTKFITVSKSSKEEILNLGLGKEGLEIVHPGVSIENLEPGEKSISPLILYLGRLKSYKSVHVLVHAFKSVLERIPHARLAIAGEGEERANLEKLALELGIKDKIVFNGKVSEKEKLNLLKRAWVFCNPSMMEGWGITTIEANACGVPVVAANVPGLRDSVKIPHTGFLAEHGNVKEFAEKISHILENHELRLAMVTNSVNWAANFNWTKSADQALKILYEK